MSTTMDTHCAVDLIISQMLYNGQSVHSFHGNVHDNRNLDIYVCTYGEIIYMVAPQSAWLTTQTDRVNQVDCAHP